jgi:NADH-quinone oxidoreductase subunit M
LKSVFDQEMYLGIISGITIILGAVYTLRLIQKSIFGNVSKVTKDFEDLLLGEKLVLIPLILLVILGGLFPQYVLSYSAASVEKLVALLN